MEFLVMKIGLVRFYNARPLDYGLREQARENPDLTVVEDTPARLYESLMKSELDAALISSVEVLRNKEKLGYCPLVGVCAREKVLSILYIKEKSEQPEKDETGDSIGPSNFHHTRPELVYTDNGSRTSVALLEALFYRQTGQVLPTSPRPPEEIPDLVRGNRGGLLIGDSAIEFLARTDKERFYTKDLAAWWYELEALPFVFALWAYPENRPLPDSLFVDSLNAGLANLDRLVAQAGFPDADDYLRKILHYRLEAEDRLALERFRLQLQGVDNLSKTPGLSD